LPLIVTLEDVTPLVIPQEMPNAAKRLAYRMLNQLAAQRARQVITLSQAARDDLVKQLHLSHDKITVIPLATFDTFQPATPREIDRVRNALKLPARYVLYLGVNKPHKNLLRLVQAWRKIQTNAVLVLAGQWDARFPEVQELVVRENLEDCVLFRHNIAEADLAPLLSGATAFVFPSLHEGFGLPPLEAMACGTPVVCANASSLPEVVGEAAILFNPLAVSAIEQALERILEDANLQAKLREKGLQRAQQFSWERTARETRRVYELALGGR
ncbi:MAG TPA: glycosyltransferase family 1 protein, partial [Anaerolineae bacterium]|nr:glycosyltransferase family 1 protein [Anaerolineae bacterium]